MAKRVYKKRAYKRRTKMTKSNLYNKRSAKQQAMQIYRVNKKLNNYISKNRLEVQQKRFNIIEDQFIENGEINPTYRGTRLLYNNYLLEPANQNAYIGIVNNCINARKLKLSGYFGICPTEQLITKVSESSSFKMDTPYPSDVWLRMIICTNKQASGRVPDYLTQSTNDTTVKGVKDQSLINGPLIKNLKTALTVLKHKIIHLDLNHPQKMFKITVNLPNYVRRVEGQSIYAYGKGEVIIYYQLLIPMALNPDLDPDRVLTPQPYLYMDAQYLYTDPN